MKLHSTDTVAILSHYYKRANQGGGPPQEIRDYCLQRVKYLYYIEHPFPYADDRRSSMTVYEGGVSKQTIFTPALGGPPVIFYLVDIFITWYFLLRTQRRIDYCIALDNLNTLSVWPFRVIGRIRKLIFYTIDYTPQRFGQGLLSRIYVWADRYACYVADAIWILSVRMTEARVKAGLNLKKSAPSIVLPMGANLDRIQRLPIESINRYQLVFVGHLLEKQGLQLAIQALPSILAKIPKAKLVVIGQGEYENSLKGLATKLGVAQNIDWQGFVATHEELEKVLCQSAIGLAPYLDSPENYTFYTDPGKPKLYLGCGLPVLVTNVPAIAKIIEEKKAGTIIRESAESLATACLELLTDRNKYIAYRAAAIELSKSYNTNTLISQAIDQTS